VTSYDLLGRVTSDVNRENGTTINQYDDDGNLLSMELGSVHRTYAYDKLNRRTDTYDENNNDVHVGYDEIGNVTSSRDADGNTTSYTYDRLNRFIFRRTT